MRQILCSILVLSLVIGTPAYLFADTNEDVNAKIEILQEQISALQGQINELKNQLASQPKETKEPKGFIERGMQSGEGFRLDDALGLESSKLNIAGEINMRYRQNRDRDGANMVLSFTKWNFFLIQQ